MKNRLILIGLLLVFVMGLIIFNGCAEKKAVVKDESAQAQKAVTDDEAALKAKEQADREAALRAQAAKEAAAKRNAAALNDLNIQNIYFDYDKYTIRPDAREILKANTEIFTKNSGASIVVEGHCDDRGTTEYNMALGERRAQEAKQYLVNLGIKESRIETISYGEERPLDTRSTEEAWAQNRRAQFLLK